MGIHGEPIYIKEISRELVDYLPNELEFKIIKLLEKIEELENRIIELEKK